jgi:hypothetical protein
MAYESQAVVTTIAKEYRAQGDAYGTAFIVKWFEISDGGHDPSAPTTALSVDPAATTIPGAPPTFGPEPIDGVEWVSTTCPCFVCKLQQGEYTGELSSVGLVAEITDVGIARPAGAPPAPTLGTTFLFAVYNRPLIILTATDGPTVFKLTLFS